MTEPDFAIDAAGYRWRIDLSAVDAPAGMRELWAHALVPKRGDEPAFRPLPAQADHAASSATTLHGDLPIAVPDDPAGFPYALSYTLTVATIQRRAGQALLLHAAGLASDDGRWAVALVAPSGMGKTTAAHGLGRAFGYMSDELVAIERDHTVHAYAKPLSILAPGADHKADTSPDQLGLRRVVRTGDAGPRLAALVLLRRLPSADRAEDPVLVPIALFDALPDLVAQTSSLWLQDRPLQWLAEAAQRGGGPYELRYTDISDCVSLIGGIFAAPREHEAGAAVVPHPPGADDRWRQGAAPHTVPYLVGSVQITGGSTVRRRPWTDALEAGGEVLLLIGPELLRLSGIGALAWLAAAEGVEVQQLVEIARAEFGEHPDSAEIVDRAVIELIRTGVLILVGAPEALA
ncbi:hypothetical protein SCMU_28950 [Sinomonas cyclohexanicum]|uniref:PqqD family peptide modification chaperone n=1 Tax=Sinomonas cyclohexanicum TaxID=322009 RepID=A0ABN6FJT3_SINCY|nr:hypothetical protein [Corynebacterium cyclohexanicum]BCT77053.1 hypothetical protein SCMU_28950 [Corynebacterium cyclohexanicum]